MKLSPVEHRNCPGFVSNTSKRQSSGHCTEHLSGSQQDVSVGKIRKSVCQKDVLLWSFMCLPVLFINVHLMIICTYIKNDTFGASMHHNLQTVWMIFCNRNVNQENKVHFWEFSRLKIQFCCGPVDLVFLLLSRGQCCQQPNKENQHKSLGQRRQSLFI